MPKRKRELTSRYHLPDDSKPKTSCKHPGVKMEGGKGSMLVSGICTSCKQKVWQDRTSYEASRKK